VAALDAFEALLRKRPFASVSMQDVARRARLSITSVYARFDGKNALLLALHERVIATALAQIDAVLVDATLAAAPLDRVVAAVVRGAVDFSDANAHVFRAVLAAADEETNQRAAAFIRAGSERLARLLGPRLGTRRTAAERDVDFAWQCTVAVLQQGWVLWGAEPGRFALDRTSLTRRLTQMFLATVGVPSR
jgi:AcrR family transcriptional regulator